MSDMVSKLYDYIVGQIGSSDKDTFQVIARSIPDKVTADKMATEKGGLTVQDDTDKKKFMVIKKGKI